MLNQYRIPWWHNLIWVIIIAIRSIIKTLVSVAWIGGPFIALWAIVKLTPFFMSLR